MGAASVSFCYCTYKVGTRKSTALAILWFKWWGILKTGIFFNSNSDIFDIVEGTHVAHVDLALHQEDMCNEQQQETTKMSSFTSLKVSPDLDVVVIISSSSSAIALNLNLYFRYVDYCNF